MRKTFLVLIFLGLAWVGYLLWPVYTLVKVTQAVEARNVPAVLAHVDLMSVRKSITDQVVDAYLKLTGKTVSPLLRGVVSAATDSVAEPIVGKIVAPEALTDFLRTGWPEAALSERPPGMTGLSSADLNSAWQIYMNSQSGLRRYEIAVPLSYPRDRQVVFEFRLTQWRWQLKAVELPQYLRVLLAEALIRALSSR